MDILTVEKIIESLHYEIEELKYRADECSADVTRGLHRYYRKLISLTQSSPRYDCVHLSALLEEALLYAQDADYRKARSIYRQVIEKTSKAGEEYLEYKMNAYVNLPVAYNIQAEEKEFGKAFSQAVSFLETLVRDNKKSEYAALYSKGVLRLAQHLYNNGLYERAFLLYEQALACMKNLVVTIPEEYLTLYLYFAELGITYYKQHAKYEQIDAICCDLAEVGRQIESIPNAGGFYSRVAALVNLLGSEYAEAGQFEFAIKLLNYATGFYDKLSNKANVARMEANIGYYYIRLGKYPEGKEFLQKAETNYKLFRQQYPEYSVETDLAKVYVNLGLYYEEMNRYEEAFNIVYTACRIYAGCIKSGYEDYMDDYVRALTRLDAYSDHLSPRDYFKDKPQIIALLEDVEKNLWKETIHDLFDK